MIEDLDANFFGCEDVINKLRAEIDKLKEDNRSLVERCKILQKQIDQFVDEEDERSRYGADW